MSNRTEREAVLAHINKLRASYPEDVFKPIGIDEIDVSRDRVGAAMARHLLTLLAEDIRHGKHRVPEAEPTMDMDAAIKID